MDGHWAPPGYWRLAPWYANWFENVAAVQFDHRVRDGRRLATVVAFWIAARRIDLPVRGRRAIDALLAAALLQVALGISTLLLVPAGVQAALGVATLLLVVPPPLVGAVIPGGVRSGAGERPVAQLDESGGAPWPRRAGASMIAPRG